MTLVQRSTEKPVLNTRLHNPGNKRPAVQTGTENDSFRRFAWPAIGVGERVLSVLSMVPLIGRNAAVLSRLKLSLSLVVCTSIPCPYGRSQWCIPGGVADPRVGFLPWYGAAPLV